MAIFGPPDPAKLEASRDVSGLIKALVYEKEAAVRTGAAGSLGRIGGPRAVQPLISALGDADKRVRHAAIGALGRIGDRGAF
ncbi:MAG: HEAT repeat domain-containing protein, partial [Candidatus Limnocylindrales bacterium]